MTAPPSRPTMTGKNKNATKKRATATGIFVYAKAPLPRLYLQNVYPLHLQNVYPIRARRRADNRVWLGQIQTEARQEAAKKEAFPLIANKNAEPPGKADSAQHTKNHYRRSNFP